MQEQNLNEVWQVDVNGTIYEAPFFELGEWIDGGSLLPQDKVRKGNLRWIEARRVPALLPFFNAKANGEPIPVVISTTVAEPAGTDSSAPAPSVEASPIEPPTSFVDHNAGAEQPMPKVATDASVCAMHAGIESAYICDGCANGFCKACPNSYGGTVKICPLCGAMCRPVGEVRESRHRSESLSRAVSEGFGMSDFFSAIGHPFKFKTSLFFGAVIFMFLTLGKGAGAMGGIFMVVGGIFAGMSANAITFGVLANTINNFIQGKLDENFMPDFDDFSLWEDVVHPFFLSIAAYISSFGPLILVLIVGFYLVTSSVSTKMDAYKSDLEKIPGTNVYAGRELVDQTGDVKDALKGIDERQMERSKRLTMSADDADEDPALAAEPTPQVDDETREQEELWATATESQKKSLESTLGKSPETEAREQSEMIQAFLGLAAPIVVIGAIAFLWGLFFFPAACAVAGYTRSFAATINPLVGLDTIKRFGVDYVKILAMAFVLLVASIVVTGILGAVFAVFNLPMVGNLPATALSALFTFYLSAVFSCILGYALYKSADRLGLSRG
jgi:hypothetical protein